MAEFHNFGSLRIVAMKAEEIELKDAVTHEKVIVKFRFGVLHLNMYPADYDEDTKSFIARNYQAFLQVDLQFKKSTMDDGTWVFPLKTKERALKEMENLIRIMKTDGRLNTSDCIELNNGKIIMADHPISYEEYKESAPFRKTPEA